MPLPIAKSRLDGDAAAYIARSGAQDRAAINAFVRGVKALGLWNNMVCWPLRSSQNAGNGDTVYSLGGLGTFNGTRVNGPGWTADGLTVDAADEEVTTSFNYTTALPSLWCVLSPANISNGDFRYAGNDGAATNTGLGFDGVGGTTFRRLGALLGGLGTRAANVRTAVAVGLGTANTFNFQDGTTTPLTNVAYNSGVNTFNPVGNPNASGDSGLGTYSFTAAFDGVALNSSSLAALYSIYRNTLGTGLGLP